LWVEKQYHGRPRRQDLHCPHTARQFKTTKSPGSTDVTPGPTDATTPAAFVPEKEREVVVDPTLPIVQVGMAHAARLHLDQGFPGPGIGHLDGDHLDRLLHPPRHHRRTSCAIAPPSHACAASLGRSLPAPPKGT